MDALDRTNTNLKKGIPMDQPTEEELRWLETILGDVPLMFIKEVFGMLKPCRAMTILEAIRAYHKDNGSNEERRMAYIKWCELVEEEIPWIETLKEARDLWEKAPHNSKTRYLIVAKWEEIAFREVSLATNQQELVELVKRCPDGIAQEVALQKLLALKRKENPVDNKPC